MDVALGIDNIVFLSILTGRLPENRRTLPPASGWDLLGGCALCCEA